MQLVRLVNKTIFWIEKVSFLQFSLNNWKYEKIRIREVDFSFKVFACYEFFINASIKQIINEMAQNCASYSSLKDTHQINVGFKRTFFQL